MPCLRELKLCPNCRRRCYQGKRSKVRTHVHGQKEKDCEWDSSQWEYIGEGWQRDVLVCDINERYFE
jgi:hypothetical protein